MKEQGKTKPPSLANWLVSKFINEALLEEFFGDLKEIYEDRIAIKGKFYAKLMYWVDVLHLLIGFTSFNLFKNQNNPTIMSKHYLIIAIRNLTRNKAYSIINILGLAVGMGVCLTICQYVYFELNHDKFHDNFENTYRIITDRTKDGIDKTWARTGYAIGIKAKEEIPEIKKYVRIHQLFGNATVTNPDKNEPFNEPALDIFYVDNTFLEVFNFPLKLGSKESVFDEMYNIVITEKTAHKYFGSDNPIGKILEVKGGQTPGNFTVSGVLEDPPINSHLQFDFLLPMKNLLLQDYSVNGVYDEGDGWTLDFFATYVTIDKSADLESVCKKLDQLIVKYNGERNAHENIVERARFQPITDIYLKSDSYAHTDYVTNKGNVQDVKVFSIIAIFILFIAWINYINLSTARSIHRAKEVGIRKSIGAFRRQLISQFMMESVLVYLIAAILSIGIAFSTLPILSNIIGKKLVLSLPEIPIFWIWSLVVIIFGSLLSGLYPSFVLSAFKPVSMLGANKDARSGNFNLRRGLITFQFLTSLLLISGTYLVYKQITFMKNKELGIDMGKIVVLVGPKTNLSLANHKSTFEAFKTKVTSHHSIFAVAGSGVVPGLGYYGDLDVRKLGDPTNEGQYFRQINADFDLPTTYDLEFIAGTAPTSDRSTKEEYIIVINEEAVHALGFKSPEKAIQEKLVVGRSAKMSRIVGVVKNFHWKSLKEAHMPYLIALGFNAGTRGHISIKMNLSNVPESLTHIEKTYKSFFPGNPFDYFFLDDAFNRQYQSDMQFGNLFLAFTAMAIFIACVGLFALVSYSATLRIKEIGIRKVLGASIGNLMMLLSKEYLVLLSIAIALAIPAILYWGSSWLENYAFKIDIGFDLFVIPALVLVLSALLTVSYRIYSTAKTNPVESLRKE